MYSELTLYYLKQMGITPWIDRFNSAHGAEHNSLGQQQLVPKLLVLAPAKQSKKAQHLLQNILVSLAISESEFLLIPVESHSLTQALIEKIYSQYESASLRAIWSLGLNCSDTLADAVVACPVLASLDPQFLLDNPIEKKKVFQDLSYLNSLL